MWKLRRYFFAVATSTLLWAGLAGAQTLPEPIRVTIAPEVPGPHELVTLTAEGVGTFLGDSVITWRQDGEVMKTGPGEQTFSFTTGPLGSRSRISLTINSAQYGTISREYTFSPALVNLLWEADTTVPPLYRGKALYSPGAALRVIAFPQVISGGRALSPNSLSYQWRINDEPVPLQSGLGKAILSFNGDQLQGSPVVSVEVYAGATRVARGELTIPARDPFVLLYMRDPLRGVLYEQALPNAFNLAGREISIKAEPFGFSTSVERSGALQYTWTINDAETAGPESDRGILTLRQAGEGAGSAMLGVSLQNNESDKFLQAAQAIAHIYFGQTAGGPSLFGL
jgi:hypothetical protein